MRLLWFFLALSALVFGAWMIWGAGWESQFTFQGSVRWLESAGPWAWAAGILLLAADLLLPVPSTVVISALGFVCGAFVGGLIAGGGLMCAGLAGYGVGRLFGEKLARRWLGDRDFEKGRSLFAKGGGWVVALSRALPILPEAVSCMAGLVRMPFGKFLTSLACGSLPMGFLFAAIGQAGRVSPGWAFGLSLIVPGLLWFVAARLNRWNIGP